MLHPIWYYAGMEADGNAVCGRYEPAERHEAVLTRLGRVDQLLTDYFGARRV